MNRVLLLMFVVLMFLYTTGLEADRYLTDTVHNRLKSALNRGAHDASLQVDRRKLAEGRIMFDRPAARKAFEQGLRNNLQLGEDGLPLPQTLFREPPELLFEDYVDESDPGDLFPRSYVQTDRSITQVLKGPAVIYQIRIRMPKAHVFSYDGYIYKTVIYEYPLNGGTIN
ncbi:hypothetical protein O9H85_22560 [Paenibacillus filicis]|uniref:DUF4309 domain-containing protein n=1 Tax=Paenibacillus gyeongsangnamensis TaxID=3388067 RepID=A0ABT4QE75_9BACL|nr:hypothetical protein [Paenibacillus filicis]MCZ8515150.1 hypothetical protein [Paenibacillus filicis]